MMFTRFFDFSPVRARHRRTVARRRVVGGLADWQLGVGQLELRVLLSGIPNAFTPVGVGGGGALFSPSINPFNPNEMFISSDMGQVFHTTDAGATWADIDFRQLQGGHESVIAF